MPDSSTPPSNGSPDRPRILVVDDDPGLLDACTEALRSIPAAFDTTTVPSEALRRLEAIPYALILADQQMPSMDGTTVLERAQSLCPSGIRVLLSDQLDLDTAMRAINEGGVFRLLQKPWDAGELVHTVLQALAEHTRLQQQFPPQPLSDQQSTALAELNRSLKKKVMERTWEVLELNRKLQQSFLAAVQAMARLGEMHSNVVGNHSNRVAEWSRKIAERLDLSAAELLQVEVAATLHDIGKTHTDPKILLKPPPSLSKRERVILRMHVIHGEAIVRLLPNLEDAARFVRNHHERFDGDGYPDRLKGRDIPLGARIVAVANAYDHALHPRESPTSAAPEQALLAIQNKAGIRLDPDLVRILTEIVVESEGDMPSLREVEIHLRDLQPGMVLARDLVTTEAVLLLKAGTRLQQEHIVRLHHHHTSDPILDGIIIRRDLSTGTGEATPATSAAES